MSLYPVLAAELCTNNQDTFLGMPKCSMMQEPAMAWTVNLEKGLHILYVFRLILFNFFIEYLILSIGIRHVTLL